MTTRPLVVPIAELRRRPGSRRRFTERVPMAGLAITTALVPDGADVLVDVELEALSTGVVATGSVTVPWEGDCRRCLTAVRAETRADVKEIFEPHPVEGETYPCSDDTVDLEPMVRDAALLALPLAPLCGPDCRGPAPELFPALPGDQVGESPPDDETDDAPGGDPRWAALSELHFDSDDDRG
ncbi:YceD family protein [Rhabdothermincola salaria]|uniref:YceD family protein n=1 Tax=Rhabdothermincola salaria TaxID=2903142 RepID=UPI001E463FBF|nr:YceD family protein [Rhabdothermincola salaria]MCD9624965.1 YceD family protein [Rhabdothermincola salaria]